MANTVTITIGARNNTDTGFARVRTAMRNLGRSLHENFGQAGRDSGMSFTDRLRNVMAQGFASIGQSGGGIGQSLGQSLSAAGSSPYVMAGIAGLVATIAPAIGTLIGGALVLGIGGGLAAIGIMAAAKAKVVQDAFGKMKDTVGKTLSEAAKPLEPVLVHVANSVGEFAKMAGPTLKAIFTDMAPVLQGFFDHLMTGFKMAAPALKPLVAAFNDLVTALGPVFQQVIVQIGAALGDLGKQFQQKDTIAAFTGMIGALFSLLPAGIKLITFLSGVFTQIWPTVQELGKAIGHLAVEVGPLFLLMVQGWVKYINLLYPAIAKVIEFIADLIEAIVSGASSAIDWVRNLRENIARIKGKVVELKQRGAQLIVEWAGKARDWINRIKGKTVAIAQRGAAAVVEWAGRARTWINNIKSKTVQIAQRGAQSVVSWVQNAIGRIRSTSAWTSDSASKAAFPSARRRPAPRAGRPRSRRPTASEPGDAVDWHHTKATSRASPIKHHAARRPPGHTLACLRKR
jgi:phage-related protein